MKNDPPPWPARRRLELAYTATLAAIPGDARTVDLWIPVAVSDPRQDVRLYERPRQGRLTTDRRFGNRMLHHRLTRDEIAAGTLALTLRYTVALRERRTDPDRLAAAPPGGVPAGLRRYLEPCRQVPLQGPAAELVAALDLPREPARAARKVYDYLIDTFVYDWQAPGAGRGDLRWACDNKTGDCTDYHTVFLALCRRHGIPADHCFGIPLPLGKDRYADWHCWARFWARGADWTTVDASEADKHPELREFYFGTLGTRCLALSHGRDVVLEPRQAGPPLNLFAAPYAEADGRPLTGAAFEVRYTERSAENR